MVAFARQHGFRLRVNQTNVRIKGLTRPALALYQDYIPFGNAVAKSLRTSADRLGMLYAPEERRRIEQLAQLAEAFPIDYQFDPTYAQGTLHPLGGILGRAYYYGALLPRLREHEALGILRSALLRVITASRGKPGAAADQIRYVLTKEAPRRFDDDASPALFEAWHPAIDPADFAKLLIPYFVGDGEMAKEFAQAALTPAEGSPRVREPDTPAPPAPEKPSRPAPIRQPGARPSSSPLGASGVVGIQRHRTPPPAMDAPPEAEVPRDDLGEGVQHALALDFYQAEDEPLEVAADERLEAATFEFEQATRHHLEGALLPDTDRSLTPMETATVWNVLRETLESAEEVSTMARAAALCAALILLSGRRRIECLDAMANHARDTDSDVPDALRLDATTWTTTIQSLPARSDLDGDWFEPTAQTLALPLPAEVASALAVWRRGLGARSLADLEQSDDWHNAWNALRDRLRQACPRFTETRGMHTLPVRIFLQTGHVREAQWLAGSSLEHSTAPGHYYAIPADRLVSCYSEAIRAMGVKLDKPAPTEGPLLIGAPRAAIRWAWASEAVKALTTRTEAVIRLGKAPFARVRAGVYALGAYSALLFGVCTAHRFTAAIADVTRRDLLVSGDENQPWSLCLVPDKSTHPALDARVCVLPALFTHQLNAYLRQLERIQRLLRKQGNPDTDLCSRVDAALDGSGPLWFAEAQSTPATSGSPQLNRATLADLWPEWAIPLPLIRHLFASHAHEFGMEGSDIARQMGHRIGDAPFDTCDPDSPAAFAHRMADKLQAYVEALGFRALGSQKRFSPPAALEPLPADTLLTDHKELGTLRQQRHVQGLTEPTDDERRRGAERVDEFARETGPDSDNTWLIDPQAIQQFLGNMHNEPMGLQQAVRRELADRVAQRRQSNTGGQKRRTPFIPQLQSLDNTYNEITRLNFDACRWALRLERFSRDVLKRGLSDDDERAILAATIILLASYGAGTTVPSLVHLLDPNRPLHAFEASDAGVVAEVPLESGNQQAARDECQLLTGDCVALVVHMRRRRTKPPTQRQIEQALSRQEELRTLLPKRDKSLPGNLLMLIGLARQCHVSGTRSAWERSALASVGPVLHRVAPLFGSHIEALAPVVASTTVPNTPVETGRAPTTRKAALQAYRRLRRLAHEAAAGRDAANNRRQILELENVFKHQFGPTSLIASLASFAVYLRQECGLADSTAYDYLALLGKRLLDRLGGGDMHAIEPDDLEQALRSIAVDARTGGQRQQTGTVAAAAAHFADILDRIGVEIDLSRAFDGLSFTVPRQPGYFASQVEQTAITSTLSAATERALATLSVDYRSDTATMAEAGALIQMHTGLRLGEVAGLRWGDLSLDGPHMTVHVHPIKRRPLKTVASRRVVVVPITDHHRDRLTDLLQRLKDRAGNTGDLLLAPDAGIDVPTIARTIAGEFRAAAMPHIDGSSARGHIARHNLASSAALATHPAWMTQPLQALEPLAAQSDTGQRLAPLQRLPAELQFRYLARQLGHGTPVTTLEWYVHSMSLLHAQTRPWTGLKRETEAQLLGLPTSKVDRWRTEKSSKSIAEDSTLRRINPAWIDAQIHPRVPVNNEATVETDEPETIDLSTLSAELAACVALTIREEKSEYAGANHWGLPINHYRAVARRLDERDQAFGLNYLTGRRDRDRIRYRIPRAHDWRSLFREIDNAMKSGTLDSESLRQWLLRQLSSRSERELTFNHDTADLARIVGEHKRTETQRSEAEKQVIELQLADRKLILLIAGVISWTTRT